MCKRRGKSWLIKGGLLFAVWGMVCFLCPFICVMAAETASGNLYTPYALTVDPIYYGQYLSSSHIHCEKILRNDTQEEISGSFQWLYPNRVLDAGMSYQSLVFVPDAEEEEPMPEETYLVGVTVNPAVLKLQLPEFERKSPFCYGDRLGEKITFSDGSANYWNNESRTTEQVEGSFSWKEPYLLPEAGMQTCRLVFTPDDIVRYSRTETTAEIKVSPRNIGLKVHMEKNIALPGETVSFTAIAANSGYLEEIPGTVSFLVDGKTVVKDLVFEKKNNDFEVSWQFPVEKTGIYRISAHYQPADGNTYAANSFDFVIRAGKSLTEITTKERLPNGQKNLACQLQLKTDAEEGVFPVYYTLKSGSLPSGIRLDRSSGLLEGIPEEAGLSVLLLKQLMEGYRLKNDLCGILKRKVGRSDTGACKNVSHYQISA